MASVPKQVFSTPRALVTRHHLPLGRPGHRQVGKPLPGPQTARGTGGTLPEERVWAGLGCECIWRRQEWLGQLVQDTQPGLEGPRGESEDPGEMYS